MSGKLIRASKKPKHYNVIGKKDPHGPDNTVSVWINESGELVIQVLKADRCYRFDRVEQDASSIRVIAKP